MLKHILQNIYNLSKHIKYIQNMLYLQIKLHIKMNPKHKPKQESHQQRTQEQFQITQRWSNDSIMVTQSSKLNLMVPNPRSHILCLTYICSLTLSHSITHKSIFCHVIMHPSLNIIPYASTYDSKPSKKTQQKQNT